MREGELGWRRTSRLPHHPMEDAYARLPMLSQPNVRKVISHHANGAGDVGGTQRTVGGARLAKYHLGSAAGDARPTRVCAGVSAARTSHGQALRGCHAWSNHRLWVAVLAVVKAGE